MTSTVAVSESYFVLTVVFHKISTLPRDVDSFVESERFMTQHGTSLYVRMFISEECVEVNDYCNVYLNSTGAVKLSCSINMVNHKDDKKSIIRTVTSYEFKAGAGRGWSSLTKSENLLDPKHSFLVQDAVTIRGKTKNQRLQILYRKLREGTVI